MILLSLCLVAFAAGFVDAIAGGGGLIQLPALFMLLPNQLTQPSAATIFGTNKFSSVWGTLAATMRYSRQVAIPWPQVAPAAVAAAGASFCGASIVSAIPLSILRYVVLALLVAVALHTFLNRQWGTERKQKISERKAIPVALLLGGAIGFYDGFFGPGTGSLLIFAFIAIMGHDFLHASASAKVVNLVTNLFALLFFASHGNIHYETAIPMACCNVAGGWLGAHLAIARGAKFVRVFFLFAVVLVICRFAYTIFAS